jgi:hypothetical protein
MMLKKRCVPPPHANRSVPVTVVQRMGWSDGGEPSGRGHRLRLGGTPWKGVVETLNCPGRRALGRRHRAPGSALDLPNLRSAGNQIE